MSRNLIARLAVAVIAIPIILWICYQGGWWLFGMILVFAILGMSEYLIAEGFRVSSSTFWLCLMAIALLLWQSASTALYGGTELKSYFDFLLYRGIVLKGYLSLLTLPVVALVFLVAGMVFAVGKKSPSELFTRYSRLLWGVLYIGLLYPYVFRVGQGTMTMSGGDSLLFLFGILWLGDTAAMFVGSQFGKHKLAPTVSPNKTVEGFGGGVIGAVLVAVIMGLWKLGDVSWLHLIVLAVGCSVFGQLGDLVESMWKRSRGIKDSSSIIPGHGGVLDRFDSLLFAAPFMYLYTVWMRL